MHSFNELDKETEMIRLTKKSLMTAALSVSAALVVGSAFAGPTTPPPSKGICHNIGGPEELGANCDQANQCDFTTEEGIVITVLGKQFLGIVINASAQALPAHIAHGDGRILATFDPPLHLASQEGPHLVSNVECLGERVLDQPPEPGN